MMTHWIPNLSSGLKNVYTFPAFKNAKARRNEAHNNAATDSLCVRVSVGHRLRTQQISRFCITPINPPMPRYQSMI